MTTRLSSDEAKRRFARNLMFWLGTIYLVVGLHGMTPYTFQLDDIKITLVHMLGPPLIVVYLILRAKGLVEWPRPVVFLPFLAYMVVMIVSTLLAAPYAKWVGWQTILMQWALLGPYLAFMVGCSDQAGARRAMMLFTILLFESTIFGLLHRFGLAGAIYDYYKATGFDPMNPPFMVKMAATFDSAKTEMMSIILNREFYGGFLALTIPMALGLLLLVRSIGWQILAAVSIPLGGICLLFTNSKGCYAAAALGMTLFALLYFVVAGLRIRYRRQILAIAAGLLALGGILALLTSATLFAQIKSVGISFNSRAVLWGGALGIWKDHPIIGAVPGGYRIFLPMHRRPDYYLYDISHVTISAHDYFLDLLCDTGVLGFVTFMSFLGILYWKNLRRVRGDPFRENRIIAMSLLAGMTGFLLSAITSPCPRWAVGAICLWSAFGVMAGLIQDPLVLVRNADAPPIPNQPPASQSQPAGRPAAPGSPGASRSAPRPSARPSPNFAAAIWLLVVLNAGLGVYSACFGVRFMRASMWNNEGVALLGDGTHEGRVTLLNRLVKDKRATLADPSLSLGDRRSLERDVASLEDEFEEMRQKTVQDFRRAVEICPNMVTSWYKLASVYSMGVRGNPTETDLRNSLAAYQSIEKYWPDYSQTPFNMGSLYLAIGAPEKALPYLKRAASMTIEPDINGVYIKTLLDLAQEKEAHPLGASGEIVLHGLPAVDTAEKLKEEALRTAVGVVEKWDKAVGHAIPIGPADRSVPRLPPVVEIGDTVRISKAGRDRALLDAANLYATTARAVGRKDAYLPALLRVHQLTPGDDSVISEIVSIYKEQGEYDSLQRFLEQILEDNPLSPKARFWLGAVLVEMGKLREAKRQAMILERISPSLPETKYLFFLVYGSADNIAKAKQFAEEYLKVCEIPARKEAIQRFLEAHSQAPPPNPVPPPAGNSGTKK